MNILDRFEHDELSPEFKESLDTNTLLAGLEEKPVISTEPQMITLDNLVLSPQVVEAIFTNVKVLEQALSNTAVVETINSILRNKANAAEMDASMVTEKKEDNAEEHEETIDSSSISSGSGDTTTVTNVTSNVDANPDADTSETSKNTFHSEMPMNNEKTIAQINPDEVYSIYEVEATFHNLIHDDVMRTKLTNEQIVWLRKAKALLNTSFEKLKDLNLYFGAYTKSLKEGKQHPDRHNSIIIPNLRDYIVLSIIYVFEKPEIYVANLMWDVFKQCYGFPAQYYTLQTFLKTLSK